MLQYVKKKLRKRETYIWELIYRFVKKLRTLNFPVI